MFLAEAKEHGNGQRLHSTVGILQSTENTVEGRSGLMQTDGKLLQQLTGLLILQSLYSDSLNENKRLKVELAKKTLISSRLKNQLQTPTGSADPESGSSSTLDQEKSHYSDSLYSPVHRSIIMKLERYEHLMAEIEGTTARGLLQQNYELKQSYHQQVAIREELEQQLQLCLQVRPSSSGQSALGFVDEDVIRKLSKSDRLLSVQKTLARELGVQLEQKSREAEILRQRLDLEQHGRKQAQTQICTLLNEFVQSCLDLPGVDDNPSLKRSFEELRSKSERLLEFGIEMVAAVQVAADGASRTDFLRTTVTEAEDNVTDMSLPEALRKIEELRCQEKRLRREAKNQVIEEMRKHKQVTMKVKDLEERLKRSEANRKITEEQLRDEIFRARSDLDELQLTLGNRSSYAVKAAESVRSLVELVEGQKLELEFQRNRLNTEVESLRRSRDELLTKTEQLESDVRRLRSTAVEEATAKMTGDLSELRLQCDRLRDENRTLQKQLKLQQERAKRDRESHLVTTKTVDKLEQQVQIRETEVKELKVIIASLTDTRQEMEAKIDSLRRPMDTLDSERQELMRRQAVDLGQTSQQRTSGVQYLGRDLPQHKLVSRSPPQSLSMSQRSDPEGQDRFVPVVGDVMAQSLPPALGAYRYRYPNPGSLRMTTPNEGSSIGTGSKALSSLERTTAAARSANDSGFPQSSVGVSSRQGTGSTLAGSRSLFRPFRDTMQCLRCGSRYPIDDLDGYEKHIRDCYSDLQ